MTAREEIQTDAQMVERRMTDERLPPPGNPCEGRHNLCLFFADGAARVAAGWRPEQPCTGATSNDHHHVHISNQTYRRLELRGWVQLVDPRLRIVVLNDAPAASEGSGEAARLGDEGETVGTPARLRSKKIVTRKTEEGVA